MTNPFRILLLFAIACIASGCANIQESRTIRLAHGLSVNHSVHLAMVKMGEDLSRLSGGKMRLEIYPNQQLGSERECIELLQIGSLDMTKVSVGVMENFAPRMKVFGMPFIFRDKQHCFNILDGPIGQELLDDGKNYWIKGLCYYDAGSRSFYTKDKPINSPDDLKGLKIRVMESATAVAMVKSLGGSPTPISWGELYTALQQGVVDGAENNPPSFYLSRHYEVCKFYSINEHTMLPDVLIMGTHLWNRLTYIEKEWVEEAAKNSAIFQRVLWDKSEKEALDAVQKEGVTINYPDKTAFSEKVKSVYEQYAIDEVLKDLIERIKSTK